MLGTCQSVFSTQAPPWQIVADHHRLTQCGLGAILLLSLIWWLGACLVPYHPPNVTINSVDGLVLVWDHAILQISKSALAPLNWYIISLSLPPACMLKLSVVWRGHQVPPWVVDKSGSVRHIGCCHIHHPPQGDLVFPPEFHFRFWEVGQECQVICCV